MDKSIQQKILAEILGCPIKDLSGSYARMTPLIRQSAAETLGFEKTKTDARREVIMSR